MSGNTRILDIGGEAYALNMAYRDNQFDIAAMAKSCGLPGAGGQYSLSQAIRVLRRAVANAHHRLINNVLKNLLTRTLKPPTGKDRPGTGMTTHHTGWRR